MLAFRPRFPAVTRLEHAATADSVVTASIRARRETPAVRARDCDRAGFRRRGGVVRGTPGPLQPVGARVFLAHDPEHYGRRAVASVRGARTCELPRRLPPS